MMTTYRHLSRSTRCDDGRLMRHDPQDDDPYLETDIGQCPECDGEGCAAKWEREHNSEGCGE